MSAQSPMEVATFFDAEEAMVAQSFLRAQGIRAELPDSNALGAMPEVRFGLGGYRLFVPAGQAANARALLAEVRAASPSAGPCCARCGGRALRRIRDWRWPLGLMALFGAAFPFAPSTGNLRCAACGHRQPDETETDDTPKP